MTRIAAMLLLSFHCLSAFATGVVSGATVTEVRVDQDGRGMVVFSSSVGGTPPGCVVSAYVNALGFDSNTAGGRSILALALAAKTTGTPIYAFGTGACGIYNVTEDWSYGVNTQ